MAKAPQSAKTPNLHTTYSAQIIYNHCCPMVAHLGDFILYDLTERFNESGYSLFERILHMHFVISFIRVYTTYPLERQWCSVEDVKSRMDGENKFFDWHHFGRVSCMTDQTIHQ